MPVYEFICLDGHLFDRALKVADYNTPQECECGELAERQISIPTIFVSQDIRYESPIDGKVITNRQQRQDDLARNGCIPYDPEMRVDQERRRIEGERKLDESISTSVEREIHAMPASKREKLTAELQGGLTADVIRTNPGV